MNEKDFDQLLSSLKNIQPNDLQTKRWQKAVNHELNSSRASKSAWYALAAGLLIGFLSATFYFKVLNISREQENLQANATFEWVLTKTE